MSEPPPLTDSEISATHREGATDEEIELVLRDLHYWSYAMRDPFGKVCAVGRGTRSGLHSLRVRARRRPCE